MSNKISLIAKRELASYFTTWTGYIVAAVALFIDGLLFNSFAIGSQPEYSAVVLDRFFYFASGVGMVAAIFLAMRLFAEERQTGTIILSFTSPVSERQLVYGKFVSALVFFLILQIISLYMPALIFIHGKVSLGHLAAGYLGVSLLGSAVLAISLLMSALAPNQLIAAVLSAFAVVSVLVLWMMASIVDPPFRDLFSFLAIHNDHFDPFRRGIVHLKHVVYYLSVTFFSLECAVRVLESRRLQG